MPLLLPKQRGVRRESNFSGRPSATWGTNLVSDGTTNVEPATETELIASTSFDTDWVDIIFHTNATTNTDSDSLVNIKVGSAGSEQTVMSNLLAGWAAGIQAVPGPKRYGFPLRIPAGSRISATHRSVRVSTGVRCMIALYGGGQGSHWTGTQVEAVGADTANSTGTYITPGGASEGTLTSLGTTTGEWGFVLPMVGGNTDTTMNVNFLAVDLASDGSTVIPGLEDFLLLTDSSECSAPLSGGRYCHVPAGTTLNLRAQGSGTAEAMAFVCYGVS